MREKRENIMKRKAILKREKRKKAATQTGLKASSPHTNPPSTGRPRETRTHPHIKTLREKTEFWPRLNEPANPGNRMTANAANGHQMRPCDKSLRPSPAANAPRTIAHCRSR